jgi:hypothetical protein
VTPLQDRAKRGVAISLAPLPPLGKNRAGRVCGLCNVSDWSLPVAALRLWQRTTEGEFYGELSTPAPNLGAAAGVLVRRGRYRRAATGDALATNCAEMSSLPGENTNPPAATRLQAAALALGRRGAPGPPRPFASFYAPASAAQRSSCRPASKWNPVSSIRTLPTV